MNDIAEKYFNLVMREPVPEPREYINNMLNLWKEVSNDYLNILNTHLIVNDIIFYALKIKDYELAEEWGKIALQYEGTTYLLGEGNFIMGKISYLRGDMEKAKEYFEKVYKNSKWRLFKGENPEYRKIVEGKDTQ